MFRRVAVKTWGSHCGPLPYVRCQATTTTTVTARGPLATASPAATFSGALPGTMAAPLRMKETMTCPMVGAAPELSCPIEDHDTALPQSITMQNIASQMGKSKLSAFVTATAVAAYVLTGGSSVTHAALLTSGTMLQSMSANTANQIIEVEHDKKMKRTRRRPLPLGQISSPGAMLLCATEGIVGSALLYSFSPFAAGLGIVNWMIYVGMYTPLKRVSAINTWVGAIVGGIPPLMGGAAAASTVSGSAAVTTTALSASMAPQALLATFTGPTYLLASLLLVWQIPHFMGLSFHCRRDYEAAGYKMLAFSNPWRASFYAVALSVLMAVITLIGPTLAEMEMEALWYYPTAVAANGVMVYKSVLFHKDPVRHCRGCFVVSYVYLSIMLMALMLNHAQPVHQLIALGEYIQSNRVDQVAAGEVLVIADTKAAAAC